MKKLIFKTILFVTGAVLIAQVLAFVATNLLFDDASDYQVQITQLLQKSSEIEIITIGNSHNLSIDFNEFDQNGYHLWRISGDFFEMKYILESLLPRLPNNKTVLIAVSYFSFHTDHIMVNTAQRRKWMYAAIPSWNFIDGEFMYFILGKSHFIFPVDTLVRPDHWIGAFNKDKDFVRAKDGQLLFHSYVTCKHYDFEKLLQKIEEETMSMNSAYQSEEVTNHAHLTTDTYQTAVDIIEYLQERDIRVVFYTQPYFYRYTELYNAERMALMKGYMEQLQQKYNIEYYDFSTDPEFTHNHRIFKDASHLNLCGARELSAKLKEKLSKNAPYLPPIQKSEAKEGE